MDEKLIDFIKKCKKAGHKKETVHQALVNAGHDVKKVEEYINHIYNPTKKINTVMMISAFLIILAVASAIFYKYYPTRLSGIDLKKQEMNLNKNNPPEPARSCDSICQDKILLDKALVEHDKNFCEKIISNQMKNICLESVK